jgi:hypothetical protein
MKEDDNDSHPYVNPMEDERHSYWTSRMLGIVGAVLFALFVAVYAYQTLK